MNTWIKISFVAGIFFVFSFCNPFKQSDPMEQPGNSPTSAFGGDSLVDRQPAVAGTFYPGDAKSLTQSLEEMFSKAVPSKKLSDIQAIIAPHAGYVFSGQVAASAYNQLPRGKEYGTIFILGSSHRANYDGASIFNSGDFITPLGKVKVNRVLANELLKANPGVLRAYPEAHMQEHSLEVQLPFLQYLYHSEMQIVPILLGTQNDQTCKKIAQALLPYLNDENLFVVSTDFSHYPSYAEAIVVDNATALSIEKNSSTAFMKTLDDNNRRAIPGLATSICGWTSMLTLLYMTENKKEYHYQKIQYMNSGDTRYGDKDRVVGYNAMVLFKDTSTVGKQTQAKEEPYQLTKEEKKQLLSLARNTILEYLKSSQKLKVDIGSFSANLLTPAGCFVTLREHGSLRGCIGRFTSDEALYKTVQEMAISSATRDTRFNAVVPAEMKNIDIEISVLTPMHKISSINEIVLGKHGIYIKKGSQAGTFLPQVATETGWDLENFLGHCAQDKAGIGWNGWKEAEIYIYEAYVFSE
jgi:MEMO1 family protein